MATAGDISAVLVGGAQRPFSGEAGRDSWTGLNYGKVDDGDKKPKDNYRAVMKLNLNLRNLQAQQHHLEASRSRLAEEITKVDSELTRIGNELRKAAAELKRTEEEDTVRRERRDHVRRGIRTEAGEALHDTEPISEEILLIEELSAPTHDRSQGEKERGTRKYLPIEACTANHAISMDIDFPLLSTPSESQSALFEGKAEAWCSRCSYKPRGNPKWFPGNLRRHMKEQHSDKAGPRVKSRMRRPLQEPQSLPLLRARHPQDRQEPQGHEKKPPADNLKGARGPISATAPLIIRQDGNGVQWIVFEYSIDRVKTKYTIRCDVESVDINELSLEFMRQNCVYPRACGPTAECRGNRLEYETECNRIAWGLAQLNIPLRCKRGLLQRAVDSWRNSSQDPQLQSRRVRRLAKVNT